MNDTDLQTIRERWAKATPGPWAVFEGHPEYVMKPDKPGSDWDGTIIAELPRDEFDLIDYPTAEAIAHAPEDVAALLHVVMSLADDIRTLREKGFIRIALPGEDDLYEIRVNLLDDDEPAITLDAVELLLAAHSEAS